MAANSTVLNLRLPPADLATIQALADEAGLSVSAYVRAQACRRFVGVTMERMRTVRRVRLGATAAAYDLGVGELLEVVAAERLVDEDGVSVRFVVEVRE